MTKINWNMGKEKKEREKKKISDCIFDSIGTTCQRGKRKTEFIKHLGGFLPRT